MNDLPVGRSVDETMRLVQAFQHADVRYFKLKLNNNCLTQKNN